MRKSKNNGESGGGRVIYVDVYLKSKLYLLSAYPKNEMENLTKEQTSLVKKIIEEIKDVFVLLHHFRNKSQKTQAREIEQAKAERNDYLARKEAEKK